jgi:hypothetical protein
MHRSVLSRSLTTRKHPTQALSLPASACLRSLPCGPELHPFGNWPQSDQAPRHLRRINKDLFPVASRAKTTKFKHLIRPLPPSPLFRNVNPLNTLRRSGDPQNPRISYQTLSNGARPHAVVTKYKNAEVGNKSSPPRRLPQHAWLRTGARRENRDSSIAPVFPAISIQIGLNLGSVRLPPNRLAAEAVPTMRTVNCPSSMSTSKTTLFPPRPECGRKSAA